MPDMLDETLDPPATIAILGAGPIGLEAALYARFLGYDVIVLEAAERVASRLIDGGDAPLDLSPDASRSPLGIGALAAQQGIPAAAGTTSPLTFREWVQDYFEPLAQSDLLTGRVRLGCRVVSVETIELENAADDGEADQEEDERGEGEDHRQEHDEPPLVDFLVHFDSLPQGRREQLRCEAVLDATGGARSDSAALPPIAFPEAAAAVDGPDADVRTAIPYLYRLGGRSRGELTFLEGLDQIRRLFAMLSGREGLNLYLRSRF